MKKIIFELIVFISLTPLFAAAGPRDAEWKKVDEAIAKRLPKSAIEHLVPIREQALKERAYAEALKAIVMKISLEGEIEGNKSEEKILRMQSEMSQAPEEIKPLMEAVLANWYWRYFQENQWRFRQRTQSAEIPGPDLNTWDLPTILSEIDKHFTKALSWEAKLKETKISDYDEFLEKGSVPDNYRPTLFDFIANDALQFYVAADQRTVSAEDEFEIDAQSPVLSSSDEFLKWKPDTTDENSTIFKAILLYQKLLAFHKNDSDKTAFIDADLWRLQFGHNKTTGEEKKERYKNALREIADTWESYEVSTRALAELARLLQEDGDLVKAREIAKRGLEAFPSSIGGDMCFNIIKQIEAKKLSIQTESVWNAPLPTIDVTYKNLRKLYFKAVPYNFKALLKSSRWNATSSMYDQLRKDLYTKSSVLQWSSDLPETPDYAERIEKIKAPAGLQPGFYMIVASEDESFSEKENQISAAQVWVSNVALVLRARGGKEQIEGFVLDAISGRALEGAKVEVFARNNEGYFQARETLSTDSNGMFNVTNIERNALVFFASHGTQELANLNESMMGWRADESSEEKTRAVFFTDRSLYRPGQTIYYKGICIKYDQDSSNYEVLKGTKVEVLFSDTNQKEISRDSKVCNDFGSFDGTFTAPRDRLAGRMSISTEGDSPSGATEIRVEEYKRPKFEVELNTPESAPKLKEEVVLKGKATAYTGTAIGGAKVKWRVEREVRFPYWCWWRSGASSAARAIAHGSSLTEADGSFVIKFAAKPDITIPEDDEPIFTYLINADVTDNNGETRSDEKRLRIGYSSLNAALDINDWQTKDKAVQINIQTQTHDNEGRPAKGAVKVYALKMPDKVIRPELKKDYPGYFGSSSQKNNSFKPDPSSPLSWENGEVLGERTFSTDEKGKAHVDILLPVGIYRVVLESKDNFGTAIKAQKEIEVLDPKANKYPIKVPEHLSAEEWSLEPGESFKALWGTGYEKGQAFIEIEQNGKLLRSWWTTPHATQDKIEQKISEAMRGGFTIRTTFVRENRAYFNEKIVEVPWTNKKLELKWEHFTSKLSPGQKETWNLSIKGPDGKKAAAELVASLYDASLDQYLPHNWNGFLGVFRTEALRSYSNFENHAAIFQYLKGSRKADYRGPKLDYRRYANYVFSTYGRKREMVDGSAPGMLSAQGIPAAASDLAAPEAAAYMKTNEVLESGSKTKEAKLSLDKVKARKNFDETAFFFPHLLSDEKGIVKIVFEMPEALTEWKFLGFAHDKELRSGLLSDTVVTSKDLMVEANPPRFVREGDTIEFSVKVSNQSGKTQSGKLALNFSNARTLVSQDKALGNINPEQRFEVPSKESRSYFWKIAVPDGMDFLQYKVVGASAEASDGEEAYLPVLSRRILIEESLPLPIRGKQEKSFKFDRLINSSQSTTLQSQSLTLQMVSQPAWYAVLALPYLMEYPHECSEQVFNRLYANVLGQHIASSDPKIKRIFDLWKGTDALQSPLEKNQDLKSLLLEETPWYIQAQNEKDARCNIALLFDSNRMADESARALQKLQEVQLSEGLWPWFPGGRPSEYISLYIMTGFGRLRRLGVEIDTSIAEKALSALDKWMDERYRDIEKKDKYIPGYIDALYLYGRSFFIIEHPVSSKHGEMLKYFLKQARRFWPEIDSRQSQAHIAIALKRFNESPDFKNPNDSSPLDIMRSLKERSVSNEELGMFWRDLEFSWWWYRAPIETQSLMIEAFDEVAHDSQVVEDLKVWLLKQKQTQDWKTTKATADAVYALLLRGTNLLSSDALVQVSLGGKTLEPEKVEAGTGFYEKRFVRDEIKPELGNVSVKKIDEGVSFGSLHWQYLEDISKVTPYKGTPLELKKTLFVKETSKKGQVLKPLNGPLQVGNELVVRVELRADRDMEYVHLKDQRGSGTEPVNVLSSYKYQDGLAYYESTKDTASHFFIDYLPKGVYVFEYSTRVQLKGTYQTGIASIECMYAPEFNSHSESIELKVE